jgi:predicted DNA-binding protein
MGTIRVSQDTRTRLGYLKKNPRESFDSVLNRLIDSYEDDDPLTIEDIKALQEPLEDVRDGQILTSEQLKKKLGLD